MVKLSDLLRKSLEDKPSDKPGLISEAIQAKTDKESLPEVKNIYDDVILQTMRIIDDLRNGKQVKGEKIVNVAKIIAESLRINNDALLFFASTFSPHEVKEDYFILHSVNTAILSGVLGLGLNLNENELVDLCTSALLHDIGFLKIPQEVINKPKELTEKEYEQIKRHPSLGMELLKNIKNLPESVPEVIYQHHEREDGSGYPKGIRGNEISRYAKIVAIVEVYETLIHSRRYRKKENIPYNAVKKLIQEERNSLDSRLIKAFLNCITPYPPGSIVLLNNSEIGRVVAVNKTIPLRPVVQIFYDTKGKPPEETKMIDLSESPVLYIEKALEESEL
jgi:HD-GYP domain-containing protein (c-di-GMP phosphodiesterase class II)